MALFRKIKGSLILCPPFRVSKNCHQVCGKTALACLRARGHAARLFSPIQPRESHSPSRQSAGAESQRKSCPRHKFTISMCTCPMKKSYAPDSLKERGRVWLGGLTAWKLPGSDIRPGRRLLGLRCPVNWFRKDFSEVSVIATLPAKLRKTKHRNACKSSLQLQSKRRPLLRTLCLPQRQQRSCGNQLFHNFPQAELFSSRSQ